MFSRDPPLELDGVPATEKQDHDSVVGYISFST